MKDNPSIRIGHLKIVDHLILGIAGFQLKKNGPTLTHSILEPVAMNSWDQICDGLKEGEINGAFITAPLAMDLFAKGLDLRGVMFTHRSGSIIVKNKAAEIRTIADFKGKTILVPSELCVLSMLFHRLLSTAGLRLGAHDDVNADVFREVVHPFLMTEMVMNDQDNDIAGFAVAEPFGSKAIHKGMAAKLCTSQSLWKNHPESLFVLKSSFIESNPEAVKEMISLFVQTGQSIEDMKKDDFFSKTCHFLDQGKEVVRQVLNKPDICFTPSLLVPDIDALTIIQDYMTDSMGVLKHKINLSHLVDSSFILNEISESHP